ncbi:hypothetical protein BDZ91DRAFT_698173 [Kalaharituber pfeilii]|nr:hypothetical protein BDZ91DRAFT_698173 [Kalaharituber pfeilii]
MAFILGNIVGNILSSLDPRRELGFLRSNFFKIVLKDSPPKPTDSPDVATDTASGQGPKNPEFFIHKSLLASLSPELQKHTNNEMREGREGVMELSEVDEPTMEAFLEWAYFEDYTIYWTSPLPKMTSSVIWHTKVYVLADRFNTVILKDLAYTKLTALLADVGMIATETDVVAFMEAVTYAYDNLPYSTVLQSPDAAVSPEKLLEYLAQYISWSLDAFRTNKEFQALLVNSTDFVKALVTNSRGAAAPPWIQGLISDAAKAGSTALKISSQANTTHVLSRSCSCGYSGVMSIMCAHCECIDHEIGTRVEIYKSDLGVIGEDRISGTKSSYHYTCKWCGVKEHYGSGHNATFYDQINRRNCYFGANTGYLYCRRCKKPGWNGTMTVPT